MRRFLFLLPVLLVGCDSSNTNKTTDTESSVTSSQPTTHSPSTNDHPAPKSKVDTRPEVADNAFANVAEAVSSLTLATETGFDEDRYRATEWLVKQGDAAVDPLLEEMQDERTGPRSQVVVTRVIGRIGTPAATKALVTIANSQSQNGAINAIQFLGQTKPSSPQIIEALTKLLDHDLNRRRLEAVKALGAIGEEAAAAGDKLIALQNSKDNDTLRKAARSALEQVKPRKTLVD